MPNRWTPRRGRGGEEERGTSSGQERLQVLDMSPKLTGSTGRAGVFNAGRGIAAGGLGDASVSAMVAPPRRDSDADESSQGLWATMGATSAFWLDLPAQVNPMPVQVNIVTTLVAAAPSHWTGARHVCGFTTYFATIISAIHTLDKRNNNSRIV